MLAADGVTHVVRIGDTVRRPARPFTATVQAYLRHLRENGIDFVPEPLGYDEQGREVLSYIDGDVPVDPLPDWATTEDVLSALARLIRRLHDASASWVVPDDAVWGGIPGMHDAGLVPLFDVPELVSHQDYCPGNIVFRAHHPYALIDFDLARPTTRVVDCANALSWWTPLTHPADRAPSLVDADVPSRVRAFADAYGMTPEQRRQVLPVAVQRAHNVHICMRAAAEIDPVFRRWWHEGLQDRLPRAEQWLDEQAAAIERALLD